MSAHGITWRAHGAMDARGLGGGLMDGAAPVATEPGRQPLAWPRDEWISARQLYTHAGKRVGLSGIGHSIRRYRNATGEFG